MNYNNSQKTKKELYYTLVNKIEKKGEYRSKRHGYYVKINVYDDYYLELDTWNKSIFVFKNNNFKYSLGIDFGCFYCNIIMVKFWLAHL